MCREEIPSGDSIRVLGLTKIFSDSIAVVVKPKSTPRPLPPKERLLLKSFATESLLYLDFSELGEVSEENEFRLCRYSMFVGENSGFSA